RTFGLPERFLGQCISLYETACSVEKKVIEANREETLRWYFYAREFKRMYKDFMVSNKVGKKKAKGQDEEQDDEVPEGSNQNNVLESTTSIPLAHNSNSSNNSKEVSPSNPLEADGNFYKMLLRGFDKEVDFISQSVEEINEEMPDNSDDDGYNGYGGYNEYDKCDRGYYYRDRRKTSPMMSPIISPSRVHIVRKKNKRRTQSIQSATPASANETQSRNLTVTDMKLRELLEKQSKDPREKVYHALIRELFSMKMFRDASSQDGLISKAEYYRHKIDNRIIDFITQMGEGTLHQVITTERVVDLLNDAKNKDEKGFNSEMCLMEIRALGGKIKKNTIQGFYERSRSCYVSTLDDIWFMNR
ncbi:hypothetical protein C1646_773401, partial [Rhizophagus diaphanus]